MAKAGTHVRQRWPLAVLLIFAVTGYLFVAGAVSAGGDDLRPASGDTDSLLRERSQRIDDRRADARDLRADIDELSEKISGADLDKLRDRAKALEEPTGLSAVEGPGVRVTLTDTPNPESYPDDVDRNFLVVHEQDIQSFVNALWAGGAEAITLQGQRLISTTGIKCVGSTVVLDGVPYTPPYVIEAIGDTAGMNASLLTSPDTVTYADYVVKYDLGLTMENVDNIKAEAYAGPVGLRYATATN